MQPDLFTEVFVPPSAPRRVITERDRILAAMREKAGAEFQAAAMTFVEHYLRNNGAASSEVITNACKQEGIRPQDDRAFGPVYMALARAGRIHKVGQCPRQKGHGTSGGNVWGLTIAGERSA